MIDWVQGGTIDSGVQWSRGSDRLESVCFEAWRNLGRIDHNFAPD